MSLRVRASTALIAIVVLVTSLLAAAPAAAQEPPAEDSTVLVFSKTAGFRHGSIEEGIAAIEALGAEHGFAVESTEDAAAFTTENLAQYDAVVWLSTTGDVLNEEQQAAFEAYIQGGGGYAGVHSASDTEYEWAWYGDLVGAYFESHPAIQEATVVVPDRAHPSTASLPLEWTRTDEWYNFSSSPRGDVHVLARLDETSYQPGADAMGYEHPIAWCHVYDGGRSWYTGMGHTEASFGEDAFLDHLLGGIQWAAGTASGDCGATVPSNYETTLITREVNEPVTLDIAPDGRVFYNSRGGQFRVYDPETQAVTEVAGVPDVFSGLEDGLIGVALDPGFAENGWIYLHYSPVDVEARRVSRFTLVQDGGVPTLTDERILLEWYTQREVCCHTGGDMAWDSQGNLYISTGDNTNSMQSDGYTPIDEREGRHAYDAQRTSGNTNDLSGKILRIHPEDDGTYTIPEGNLFPADEYPDDSLVRREVYVMGQRNPYRIWVDPETDWLYVGNVGPDAFGPDPNRGPASYDEWEVFKEPANAGWPYCSGPNEAYNDYDFATGTSGAKFDCQNLVNDSPNNTGLTELPPAEPADVWYRRGQQSEQFPWIEDGGGNTAMSGVVYRYDESIENETKFPEYWDGKWFVWEWSRMFARVLTMDPETEFPVHADPFPPLEPPNMVRPFDMEFGPDGTAYVLDYGTGWFSGSPEAGLYRIEYTGGQASPVPQIATTPSSGQPPLEVAFSSDGTADPQGTAVTYAWDFDGDGTVDSTDANPTHTYQEPGQYTARLTVVDPDGNEGTITTIVTVGNTQPEVEFTFPPEGGFFEFGDQIAYEVTVDDAEDGSTADGEIDCNRVEVSYILGHDAHGHPAETTTGCEGVLDTGEPGSGHGLETNVFGVLSATYTDEGGDGVPALDDQADIVLQPKHRQAEHFDARGGGNDPQIINNGTAEGGRRMGDIHDGEWIMFSPVNFHQIDSLQMRVSSGGAGGTVEVRVDAPDGPLVGSVEVPNTGGWESYQVLETEIADPGGTHDLYLVFSNPGETGALFDIDWFEAVGKGVSENARPRVTVSADPNSGAAPLEVQLSADAVDPEGGELTYAWDLGDGTTSTQANPLHVYEQPGTFTATVTVTDPGGAFDTDSVRVSTFAPADECLREQDGFCVLELRPYFNNDGIQTGDNPSDGDFDGGGWSFPAEELPDPGPVEFQGVPYEFPDGQADNVDNTLEATGQTIGLMPGSYGQLHILATAHNGDVDDTATVTYTDGSTSQIPLRFTDWAAGPRFGEDVAFTAGYRYDQNGETPPPVNVFHQVVPLDPTREPALLTLPNEPRVHIFALTLDPATLTPELDLTPAAGEPYVGDPYTLTAALSTGGVANGDTDVTVEVYRQEGDGDTYALVSRETVTTDDAGEATFTYSNDAAADDVVVVCDLADCVEGDTLTMTDGAPANLADAGFSATATVSWTDQFELEPGYQWLFDGTAESLEDWSQAGPGSFTLANGAITSEGGLGLLWYDAQQFGDFSLRMQWKVEEDTDNSGVFVRFPNPGDDPGVAINQGYEVQIREGEANDAEPQKTGSIYNFDREDARNARPTGQWNDYEIIAEGQQFTVILNGEVVNTYTGDGSRALEGFIGLQNHGAGDVVSFRNVRIADLDAPPAHGDVFDTVGITDLDHTANAEIYGSATRYAFVAELMPDGGQVVVPPGDENDDVPVRLPDTSGVMPNLAGTNGQVYELPQPQTLDTLHVFGSATDAGQGAASGEYTLTFADGTTETVTVSMQDWGYPGTGSADSHIAIGPMEYRYNQGGRDGAPVPFHFYHQAIPVESDAELVSITFPTDITAPGTSTPELAELYVLGLTFSSGDEHVAADLTALVDEEPDDTTAPTVEVALDGEQDDEGAYTGPVQVTVTAADEDGGSGVETVEYRLDDGDWTAYGEPFTVSAVGDHTVEVRATDAAGNAAEPVTATFTIVEPEPEDTTPPTVEIAVEGDGTTTATVTVSADDGDGSGVDTVEYRLDGGAWTAYDGPVEVSSPGAHTVDARATDVDGNASDPVSAAFTVAEPEPEPCPEPDDGATVVIGGVDSGVPNRDTGDGCTIADLIDDGQDYANRGQFIRHVSDVLRDLYGEGLVSGRERGAIIRAASRSGVGDAGRPGRR